MRLEQNGERPINDYWVLSTVVKSDASSILLKYITNRLIDVDRVGGKEEMLKAYIEGLLDAVAETASQSNLTTDEVRALLNQKMQKRGVKPTEIEGK